jgi:hypothetical protein
MLTADGIWTERKGIAGSDGEGFGTQQSYSAARYGSLLIIFVQ